MVTEIILKFLNHIMALFEDRFAIKVLNLAYLCVLLYLPMQFLDFLILYINMQIAVTWSMSATNLKIFILFFTNN